MKGEGNTFVVLAACATAADTPTPPPTTLDGRPLTLSEVLTSTLSVVLGSANSRSLRPVNLVCGWPR